MPYEAIRLHPEERLMSEVHPYAYAKNWGLRNANFYANFISNRYPRMPTNTKSLWCSNFEQAISLCRKNRTRTDLFHPCGFLAPFPAKPFGQLRIHFEPVITDTILLEEKKGSERASGRPIELLTD